MPPTAASLVAPMASSLIQPMVSSWINAITRKEQEDGFLPLLVLSSIMKILGKRFIRAKRGYNNRDKNF